jgi:hypothetical protein
MKEQEAIAVRLSCLFSEHAIGKGHGERKIGILRRDGCEGG